MTQSPAIFDIVADFSPAGDQPQAIASLCAGIEAGLSYQTLLGVTGSGKTFTMAHVIEAAKRPTLILAPNKTLAAQLYGEMKSFFPHNAVEYFVSYYDYYQPEAYVPSSDTYIEKDAAINEHIEQMRLSATKALLERRDTIIVATVSAIYGLGDPDAYLSMVLHVKKGDIIDQRSILRRLAELQYTRNDTDFRRATYRVRGDTIDIFPAESAKDAVRISLFDEEIDAILLFDPLTGTVNQSLTRTTIYPKTHYATPREKVLQVIDTIKEELQQRLSVLREANKLVEAQRLEQRTLYDLEMLVELGYCNGIENYSRYLSGREAGEPPPTLFDYLPADGLLIIDESHVMVPQLRAMYRGDRSRKETLVEYGFRLPSALDNRPLMFEEFVARSPQTVFVSATPSDYELDLSGVIAEQVVRPTGLLDPVIEIKPVASQVDDVLAQAKLRRAASERVLVTTLTKRMAEDLTEYLNEHGIKARYLHSDVDTVERVEILQDLRLGKFDVLVGINLLREGLDLPEVSLIVILDADKEGFLRSDRSLIQTMGRAARNINGKAILYADKITDSMRRAIDETERRRQKQIAYNEKHGITPKSTVRAITDVLERGHVLEQPSSLRYLATAKQQAAFNQSPEQIGKRIKQLEKQMRQLANELAFEQAAAVRDEIIHLEQQLLGIDKKA